MSLSVKNPHVKKRGKANLYGNSHHAATTLYVRVLFTYSDAVSLCVGGCIFCQLDSPLGCAHTSVHTACTHAHYMRSGCVYLNAPRGRVLSCIMTSNWRPHRPCTLFSLCQQSTNASITIRVNFWFRIQICHTISFGNKYKNTSTKILLNKLLFIKIPIKLLK